MSQSNHPWIKGCTTGVRSLGVLSGLFIVGLSHAVNTEPSTPSLPGVTDHLHAQSNRVIKPTRLKPRPAKTTLRMDAAPMLYPIAWGDTLLAISAKFHISIAQLMRANHLTNDVIYANTTLLIPGIYTTTTPDTLASVARQFHVTTAAIQALNPNAQNPLVVGEPLAIPYHLALPKNVLLTSAYARNRLTVGSDPPSARAAATRERPRLGADSIRLLAHLVQAEAGNQSFLGQVAVAAVVLNRLGAPGFPKSLAGVIEQPGQFQCVANGTIYQPPSQRAWLAAKSAASGWDPTDGALYYYNPNLTANQWIRTQPVVTQIGQQIFAR
ncbi:MAG: cell wall hydrolase [Firmicutes bacterium]|nr:cell wall hydrolase [Bacillota bacterium]MCL5066065.1 cell wall hydrolase [Bacillota bacterium]